MITVRRQNSGNGHRYYVEGDDRVDPKKPMPSCTGIAGYADNSGSDGLMTWAVNLYQDSGNRLEYKSSNAKARDIGTKLHAEIEEYIATDEQPESPSKLFGAWYAAINENGVKFIAQEMLVYHPYFQYGGTLDAIGYVDGVPTLFDWKTTDEYRIKRDKDGKKGMRDRKRFNQNVGYAVQLGGYMLALKEMAETDHTVIPTQAYIVYVFKDTLKTEWVKVNLNTAEQVFAACANLSSVVKNKTTGGLYEV